MTFEGKDKFNASVNSTCAQPFPRATAGHLPALSVPGVGIFNHRFPSVTTGLTFKVFDL